MLNLELILRTAGYNYDKFTMLMHTKGFFSSVEGAYTYSLPSFVDCNVALFEKSKGFHAVNDINGLSALLTSLSVSIGEWAKNEKIGYCAFYECVDGKNLKATAIMHSLQCGKDNFIACSNHFKNDMNKFIDAVAKKCGISKS